MLMCMMYAQTPPASLSLSTIPSRARMCERALGNGLCRMELAQAHPLKLQADKYGYEVNQGCTSDSRCIFIESLRNGAGGEHGLAHAWMCVERLHLAERLSDESRTIFGYIEV